PRAKVEAAYRRSHWTPVSPRVVAEVLASEHKRLIRSGEDAVDGVVAAIEYYAARLRLEGSTDIEDLWNLPKKATPTPREEERVSVKIDAAVRDYFRNYAVAADREVQIFRRKISRSVGGAPGSEVDLLVSIPATGTANADPIVMPLEVKLSHNAEARTGLRD